MCLFRRTHKSHPLPTQLCTPYCSDFGTTRTVPAVQRVLGGHETTLGHNITAGHLVSSEKEVRRVASGGAPDATARRVKKYVGSAQYIAPELYLAHKAYRDDQVRIGMGKPPAAQGAYAAYEISADGRKLLATYGPAADVYSLGLTLFFMLSHRHLPFGSLTYAEHVQPEAIAGRVVWAPIDARFSPCQHLFTPAGAAAATSVSPVSPCHNHAFLQCRDGVHQDSPLWRAQWANLPTMRCAWVSPQRDFIQRLVCIKPGERLTAAQALKHPWLTSLADEESPELLAALGYSI